MNCLTISIPDVGHICEHHIKINRSQWAKFWHVGKLVQFVSLKIISEPEMDDVIDFGDW